MIGRLDWVNAQIAESNTFSYFSAAFFNGAHGPHDYSIDMALLTSKRRVVMLAYRAGTGAGGVRRRPNYYYRAGHGC